MTDLVAGTEEFDEFEKEYELENTVVAIVYTDKDNNEYALHGSGWLEDTENVEGAKALVLERNEAVSEAFGFTATDRTVTLEKGTKWRNDIIKENPDFDPNDIFGILFDGIASHFQAMKL